MNDNRNEFETTIEFSKQGVLRYIEDTFFFEESEEE